MSCLDELRKNLRGFRALCEGTMRVSGTSAKGLRGVEHLRELEAVFAGERAFRGELLEPLSAFSNVLASGRLTFGDACSALSEVLACKGAARWHFDPDVSKRTAERLDLDRMGAGLDRWQRDNQAGWDAHARENRRFVLSALERARGHDVAVMVGAARAYDVPLAEIARRFARVVVVDVSEESDTRRGVARALPDPALLARVSVERFDLTGTYNQFAREVSAIAQRSSTAKEAARAVDELVSGYDVPEGAVRLCRADVAPDFVVSSMVLTQLGLPFASFLARVFRERGFDAPPSLAAFACRLEQHHVAALLRIPSIAVLTSDVSETTMTLGARGELVRVGEPRTQLSVETLLDRLPSGHEPISRGAWEWLRVVPKRAGAPGASMNVEGLVLQRS